MDMIRGLYIAASSAISESKRIDVISNNIANVNTSGFKKDTMLTTSFQDVLMKRIGPRDGSELMSKTPMPGVVANIGKFNYGVHVDQVFTNFEQGSLSQSSNPLDLALQGKGFFTVETPEGQRYTRDGEFTLDAEGYLTTKEGYKVLGQNGPIKLEGKTITINESGKVFSDENEIDTLKLVDFNDYKSLRKEGDGLFYDISNDQGNVIEAKGTVQQGFTEGSNVNSVKQMVEMITALRTYEANQKIIKTHDELLGKAVNEIARV